MTNEESAEGEVLVEAIGGGGGRLEVGEGEVVTWQT